jgi:proliferating cell nuclear antigen
MFQASLAKALTFKRLIDSVRELVTDVNIEVSAAGLALQAMDTSHVALVSFLLRAGEFENFSCEAPQLFGVTVANLAKVLKCAENEDRIILRSEPNSQKLTVIFEGADDSRISLFKLNLINLDSDLLGIPDLSYTAAIQMRSQEFARVSNELGRFSDTISVRVERDRVTFGVSGDIGEGDITFQHRPRGPDPTAVHCEQPVSCAYAMRYLALFAKAAVLAPEVILSVSEGQPLIVSFEFGVGFLKFYLAPKVDD